MKFLFRMVVFLAMVSLVFASVQVAVKETEPRVAVAKYENAAPDLGAVEQPCTLPPVGSRNPHTLDEVIISQGFEGLANWALPTGWIQVDVDNGYCDQFTRNSTWGVYNYGAANAHTGTNVVMNHYNTSGLQNNDWLILPQQNLTGTITLTYWAASQDPLYLESYEVRVSTTGTLPANFTNVIYTGTNIPSAWTQHVHDLSTYAGAPFYIAFHYISADEFVLKIDDLLLEAGQAEPMGVVMGTVTNAQTSAPLAGVAVAILGTQLTATTDASGGYTFPRVPPGTYNLQFTRDNFVTLVDSGNVVVADDTTTVNVAMTPSGGGEAINEDFEGYANWALPPGWIQVDVDNGYCDQFTRNSTWGVYNYGAANAHSGTNVVMNHYNTSGLANNDWLILPQQTLGAPITFTYWAASQDPLYLENYEVRVSTTGSLPANFTNLIYTGTNIPTAWTEHTHDLSAYAGIPIYIAFHYISADEFVLKIDDVVLEGAEPGPMGIVMGTITNSQTSQPMLNVQVAILGTSLTANTNAQGRYTFAAVDTGTYDLRFTRANFDTAVVEDVVVTDGDTTTVNVAMDPTNAIGDVSTLPREFKFYGNYPNPFNAQTQFSFALDRVSEVELVLYNVAGQEVARLVNDVMSTGEHVVSFDASTLSTGVYIARLTAGQHTATHKLMLLK